MCIYIEPPTGPCSELVLIICRKPRGNRLESSLMESELFSERNSPPPVLACSSAAGRMLRARAQLAAERRPSQVGPLFVFFPPHIHPSTVAQKEMCLCLCLCLKPLSSSKRLLSSTTSPSSFFTLKQASQGFIYNVKMFPYCLTLSGKRRAQ